MKVREALEEYQGVLIKIGARVGFIYCDICDEHTQGIIEDMSKEELKALKKKRADVAKHLKNFKEDWKKIKVEKARKGIPVTDVIIEKDRINTINDYKAYDERIKKWIPFLDREVKKVYNSIILKKQMIIIFDGLENGKYWDIKEYKQDIM